MPDRRVASGPRRRRPLPSTETVAEEAVFVPGPWEFMDSSRVSRARYDSTHHLLEVDWVDGGLSYLYRDVPPEVFRRFLRVASPGKFVNRVLDGFPYEPKVF